MRFPSRTGRLFWFLFWLAVGPLVLIFPASAWLAWTLQPLQKVYLTTYAASSVGAGIPHSEMSIRWVMKTAPRRKPVPASAEDVIAGPDAKLPVSLSPKAIAEGWRGVAYSAPEKVPADSLAKGLRDYVYDGVSVEIATKPLVMASEISGLEPLHGFIKQENRVVPVLFRLARKHSGQPEFIERKLPEIAPRPSPPPPVARAEQPRMPAAAQATLPLFDAPADKPTDKPKEAFVWDESKGIE